MESGLKIAIFVGSVREGRIADRVLALVQKELTAANVHTEVFDPAKMPFEMVKQPLHFYPDQSAAPQWLRDAHDKILAADGFLVISAEYNCTIPPALTNMMDHFSPASYANKPCAIATYSVSGWGGCRAAVALRPFLAELQMPSIPTSLTIPNVTDNVDASGNATDERTAASTKKLVQNLLWFTNALKKLRYEKPQSEDDSKYIEMSTGLKILIFVGSAREGRMADRVLALVQKELKALKVEAEVFDPNKMPFEIVKQPIHFYPNPSDAPEWLREANDKIQNADGYLVISAEYNCTMPPALTNMMDHFPPWSYAYRPAAIAAYSVSTLGGCRVAAALRPFLTELQIADLPSTLTIPNVAGNVDENGNATDDRTAASAKKLVQNLISFGSALKKQREEGIPK